MFISADMSNVLDRILDAATDNLRIAKILIQMGLDPNNVTYDAIFNRLLEIFLHNINLANMFALVGAIFFVATLLTQTMVPLRVANMIGCAFFAVAGALTGAVTTFLLYLLMIPINAYRLRQMLALVKKARNAIQGDTSMEWLKPFMTQRKYRRGDILMRKGDVADEMLLTVTGRFRVIEIDVELPPGNLMGELGFLTPDNRRTATIECIEDGHVLTITYEKLLEIYFQNPQFGYYFLVLTSQRLLQNLARAEAIIAQNKIAATDYQLTAARFDGSRTVALLGRRGPDPGWLRARGAELELGDLAERVERGIGEQVGRRLRVAERHEHHVLRHVAVGAHLDLDRAAARLHANEVAGRELLLPHLPWRHEGDRLGLDLRRARWSGASSSRCASARARGRWTAPSDIRRRAAHRAEGPWPARSCRGRSRSGSRR